MAVDEKEFIRIESECKKKVFNKIHELCLNQSKIISNMDESSRYIHKNNESLPNIGITLNNKVVQLTHQFEKSGISMFASKIEDYGPFNINTIDTSFLGNALLNKMISYVAEGNKLINDYITTINEINNRKLKEKEQLVKSTPMTKLFNRIRAFFVPIKDKANNFYTRRRKEKSRILFTKL